MSFLGIPQFTLDLIAFVALLFCMGLGASNREEKPEQPNKPKKKQVINIIDSVVQRTCFNTEADDEGGEAVSALMSLGFRKTQARDAVRQALFEEPLLSTEELIKTALQKV